MNSAASTWSVGELDSWLSAAVERSGVPGASVAILTSSELLHAEAGVLEIGSRRPVTPASVFQIGSTTKVLTAAVCMQLADDRRLDLDEPIRAHLGPLDVGGFDAGVVSLRQLLDHTSGLPGHYFVDFGPGAASIRRYVESLSTQQMIHPPGAMFSYCNAGYVVAGRLAEVVTGQPFADVIQHRIADPLGLTSTTARRTDVRAEHLAVGHEVGSTGAQRVAELQTVAWSSAPAGSIMLSTAIELATIGSDLCGGASGPTLVSPGAAEAMTTPSVELPCPYWSRRSQCLGWGADRRDGVAVLLHGGGTTGHSALLISVPEHGVTMAVLTNTADGAMLLGEAERWLCSRLGLPSAEPAPPAEYQLTDSERAALVGTYTDIWTTTEIRKTPGGLSMSRRIHPSAVSPALELPETALAAIGPRALVAGAGRPMLFLAADPADQEAPIAYLHQLNASRRLDDIGSQLDTRLHADEVTWLEAGFDPQTP